MLHLLITQKKTKEFYIQKLIGIYTVTQVKNLYFIAFY